MSEKIVHIPAVAAMVVLAAAFHASTAAAQIDFTACRQKLRDGAAEAQCGTISVAENRADVRTRTITLPVIRVHALSGERQEPIFRLEGGPGISNMEFRPPSALLQHHDIVMVGYRGVDGSSVLDCPEVTSAFRGAGGLLSDDMRGALADAARHCAARLRLGGADLAGYTIAEVVRDLDQVRAALGYERINLLSESYGTRLAQTYAALYPARIHRSAMLGVNPPGHFVWEPQVIDAQLGEYAVLCAADPHCRARAPDLVAAIAGVLADPPRRWLGLAIDPGKVRVMSFILLFHRKTAPYVFDAFAAAQEGDASGLALLSAACDLFLPKFAVWGDFLAKGGIDFDPARNYGRDLLPPKPAFGSPLSALFFDGLLKGWPRYPAGPERALMPNQDVPTLLAGGTLDFSTPLQFAKSELLPRLRNAQLVAIEGMGHTDDVWTMQPEATDRLLTSFFATGQADSILFVPVTTPLMPRFGLGFIAKLLLVLAIVLPVALAAGLWLALRRIGRRRRVPA